MKIAIEAQRLFRPDKHGMDFVVLEQLREIQRTDTSHEYYVIVAPGTDRCFEASQRMHIVELRCPTYPLWEQIALPLLMRKLKPDLLHCTSNTAPLWCNVPLILTLHDIIYMEKRHSGSRSWYQRMGWYYRRFVVPRIIPKCCHIITVSATERERILTYFGLPTSKISVLHNGYSTRYTPAPLEPTITHRYVPQEGGYLFFMGNTEPRKNTRGVLKTYSLYRQYSVLKLPLLLSGLKPEELSRLLKEEALESLQPFIYCPGYLPSTDMPALYRGAKVFLFPSLSEGFGMPIIEAMACGTPVITSNTSAMPEVAGSDALLVDPLNEQQIADTLVQLEQSSELYQAQRTYGLERAKRFSWKQNAIELIKLYKEFKKKD